MPKTTFTEQIKAISKISKAITSDIYLDDILRLIVTVTAEILGSPICSLMLLDEKSGELRVRATQSISEEYNKKPPLKLGEGIAGKVAQQNKAMAVLEVVKEKEYKHKDIAKREGLCSLLCVPLSVKGKVIGVINCYTSKPHTFSDSEIEVLNTIANQAAVAIENIELRIASRDMLEELETRKKTDRAKGILMRDEGLTEEQAYLKIRKYSMDKRKSMKEVSEAIILAAEMKRLMMTK